MGLTTSHKIGIQPTGNLEQKPRDFLALQSRYCSEEFTYKNKLVPSITMQTKRFTTKKMNAFLKSQ